MELQVRLLRILIVTLTGFALSAFAANARIVVDVNRGHADPLPIAITDLLGSEDDIVSGGSVRDYGRRIALVVKADLTRSGLFRSIDSDAFIKSANAQADLRNPVFNTSPKARTFMSWDMGKSIGLKSC